MPTEIRQSQLRNDNAVIMRRVAGGESFVVTVNGKPVADVVPHRRDPARPRFVPFTTAAAALSATPIPRGDAEQWWRDIRAGTDEPEDPWERQAGLR